MKKDAITFKGSREGLIVLCDEAALWDEILDSLKKRLQGREGIFFEGASVVIDTGSRILSTEQVSALWGIFHENGVSVKTIKTGMEKEAPGNGRLSPLSKEREALDKDSISDLPTLVIRRNIRSGQDISFHGNIVIFGDVKPGAEITASGFVLVLGDLRGTVHAGAAGDAQAWVSAFLLQPTQLRIADHITRAPEEEPTEPELARIIGKAIVVSGVKDMQKYFKFNGRN